MKILFVVNSFPKISETFIFNKIHGLKQCGFKVDILCHSLENDSNFFKERMNHDVKILYSPLVKKNRVSLLLFLIQNLKTAKKIWSELNKELGSKGKKKLIKVFKLIPLKREQYDIIHFEFSGLAIQYLEVLPLIKAKKFMSCRGAAEQIKPLHDKKRKQELTKVLKLVDKVHCVSKNMQKTMLSFGMGAEQSFVNHPSINIDFFTRAKPYQEKRENACFTILSTGRLHWKKGFNYALLAFKELLKKGYEVKYEIIGSGAEIENLSFLVNYLELEEAVELKGALSSEEVKKSLEVADGFLLPSLSEGLSNAVLEAMAMELPVISTKAGGMEEAIIHGKNGLLVDLMDYQAMAENIEYLINNKSHRISLGQKARKTVVENFNLRSQIEIFNKAYFSTKQKSS